MQPLDARLECYSILPRVHALVADAMNAHAYGRWTSMLNESLLHVMEARYALAHQGPGAMPKFFTDQRRGSWFWVEELSNLYAEYEANRQTYPTFASFMPRVSPTGIRFQGACLP